MLFLITLACQPSPVTPELRLLKQLEDNPQQASTICPQLNDQKSIQYCQQIALRPHLWDNPASMTTTTRRSVGPNAKHLLPNIRIDVPPFKPPSEVCSVQCWEERAMQATEASQAQELCQHNEKERWRAECIFVVAEKKLTAFGYEKSAELCIHTGSFAANCFMHLSN